MQTTRRRIGGTAGIGGEPAIYQRSGKNERYIHIHDRETRGNVQDRQQDGGNRPGAILPAFPGGMRNAAHQEHRIRRTGHGGNAEENKGRPDKRIKHKSETQKHKSKA